MTATSTQEPYPTANDTVAITVRLKRGERELLSLLAHAVGDRSVNLIVASLIRTDMHRWFNQVSEWTADPEYVGQVGTVAAANAEVFCRLYAEMNPALVFHSGAVVES